MGPLCALMLTLSKVLNGETSLCPMLTLSMVNEDTKMYPLSLGDVVVLIISAIRKEFFGSSSQNVRRIKLLTYIDILSLNIICSRQNASQKHALKSCALVLDVRIQAYNKYKPA